MNETIRDCKDNVGHCYLWHKALGGRGSDQVVSVLYKHTMSLIPPQPNIWFSTQILVGSKQEF
jgi:hypothetical protein